ncbi:MAG: DUF2726 domain-containing protein [Candidatus Pacebacteria bacterium]|nr:DUF2726 domain-containing protein [Candidatus Paceibacterota bacterium]
MKFIFLVAFIIILVLIIPYVKAFFQSVQLEKQVLPYRIKYKLFSNSEMIFLKILDNNIDHSKYTVFPKVRLADFVEVTSPKEQFQGWFNKIKSKHVDFILWDLNENKISLAIELDGKSHQSDHMKERDAFVNELYETVGMRLERIKVGSDFDGEVKKILQSL